VSFPRGGHRPPLFRWPHAVVSLAFLACGTPAARADAPPSPGPPPAEDPAARDERVTRLLVAEAVRLRLLEDGEARASHQEARRRVLREAVEERLLTPRTAVGDAEVEAEYQRNRDKFAGSPRLKLRHVFRRVSAAATAAEKARAAAEMADLRARIAGGADMGQLARTLSDSQTARYDGLLMPAARGAMDAAVETVVWSLETGQLSEVVVTPVGLHVFRLEERLPAAPLDEATARSVVRQRLRVAARARARADLLAELAKDAGARYMPERAELRRPDSEIWYERRGRTITAGEIAGRSRALAFPARRTRPLRELLEEEVWNDLLLFRAERMDLARDPAVAARLSAVDRDAQREAAWARRLRQRRERITDADLLPFLARTPPPTSPETRRLRALVVAFRAEHTPHYAYEQAEAVARELRAGKRTLEAAARASSDDPSAADGGDLGDVTLREVGVWAGTAVMDKVRALPPGELGGPWLVEVYDESQLSYVPRAYVLVRVEAVTPSAPLQGAAAREEALRAYFAANAGALVRELEEDVLAGERAPAS
jgi:parvulin-like peptidyl-prolyl isomerase